MRRIDRLVPERHRGFAMAQMKGIVGWQRWGVGSVNHKGWRLFFKGGWGISAGSSIGTVHHQVALLKRGKSRIGISVLTRDNPSGTYGAETLRGVFKRLIGSLPR